MLKTGNDLNLIPIKCESKEGTDKLKEYHHQINDILYKNRYKYIDQKLANTMYTALCDLGVKIDELEVPERARDKKRELLGKLRTVCTTLKDYRKVYQTEEDVPLMQKALGWFVHTYIEAKKNDDIKPQEVLEMLIESRRLWDAFCPFEQHLRTDTFIKVNGELVRWFESKYSIRELNQ